MSKSILKLDKLTKYYGNVLGVKDLTLDVKVGEIFGFIGPNGAGKSTTIKCILNQINKTSGTIKINEEEVSDENYKLKELIGYLPSEVNLYEELKVIDMLKYSDSFYNKDTMSKALRLSKRLDLDLNKKIEDLSLGNKKKLGVILALMHSPKLIIMDEATSSLDPLVQEELFKILKEEKSLGNTVFFSSHILSEIKKVCDRVGVLRNGKLINIEDIDTFKKSNLVNVYLESNDLKLIEKDLKIEINSNRFNYNGDINKLIKSFSKYKIDKLLIEEMDLESVLMHYYKEDM